MNEVTKTKQTSLIAYKEQEVLLPIAESYIKMFPEVMEDKTFNAKQAIISMALKMNETLDKAGRKAIDICTKESIMQVAQEVLVKKLDLMKNQGALIVRGDKLKLQPQYQGNVKRALELNPFLDHFNFMPIYKDDKITMKVLNDGKLEITNHETSFNNIGNSNLVGGYVRAISKDGSVYMTEIMNMEQIKIAWSKSSSSQSVHKEFPLKMIRKTLLNSICSWLINTTGEKEENFDENYTEEHHNMDIEINENQEYAEPIATVEEPKAEEVVTQVEEEDDDGEWSEEDMNEVMAEIEKEEMQYVSQETKEEQQIVEDETQTVSYYDWVNTYKPTNEWEQVKDSYNKENKTVLIKKKKV